MSVKEMLSKEIQDLTEEQARRVLYNVFRIKSYTMTDQDWERLGKNASLELPKNRSKPSRKFEPIKGWGIPASQLLIEDRR